MIRISNQPLALGFEYRPRSKNIAWAALIPMAISAFSAVSNYISGRKQNEINEEINEQNAELTREGWAHQDREAMNARFWQANEFDRQFGIVSAYNDPARQADRLRDSGINPAVAFEGAQTSAGSMSQGNPSAPMAQTNAPIPYSSYGMPALNDMGSLMKDIASAMEIFQKIPYAGELFSADIKQKLSQAGMQDAQKQSIELGTFFEQLYGDRLRDAQLQKLVSEANNQYAQAMLAGKTGDYYDARTLTESFDQLLKASETRLNQADFEKLEIELKYKEAEIKQMFRLRESAIASNQATAALNFQQATTEEKLRPHRVRLESFKARTEKFISELRANEANISTSTLNEQMQKIAEEAKQLQILTERREWENEVWTVDKAIDWIHKLIPFTGDSGE